ncbi:MAG: hypothetical protein PHC44_09960 [Lutispora sp.]|nr:hypothetical protein [Lutispora sp.]
MNVGNLFALNGKIETEALSVVGFQFAPIGAQCFDEVDENIDTVLEYMERAVAGFPGLDLFVAPEACFQGFPPSGWQDYLLDINGFRIQRVKDKCKELNIWGIFNPLVKPTNGNCYENTAIVIDNNGHIVHKYTKMNPWIPFETMHPGISCPVCDGPKGSKIGIIICADGDYPEMWREAAYNGANVIVRPTHYMDPWSHAWDITNKAGAYFNQVYVVAVNCSGYAKNESFSCFGRSMILGPDGNVIVEGSNGNIGLIKADLYPGIIDHMRKQAVHSNPMYSFRHRGGSCPDFDGKGDVRMLYNAYKEDAK